MGDFFGLFEEEEAGVGLELVAGFVMGWADMVHMLEFTHGLECATIPACRKPSHVILR